jgi:hypothetical protein
VNLQDRGGRQPCRLQSSVKLFDVFRLEPVQPVPAETWYEVMLDLAPVTVIRRWSHLSCRDDLQPVPQPLLCGWSAAGVGDSARRVSTQEQAAEGASLEAQEAALVAEAGRRRWDLEVIADEDSRRDLNRPWANRRPCSAGLWLWLWLCRHSHGRTP